MSELIRLIANCVPVADLHRQLLNQPELWNQHRERTKQYAHSDISDIWVRYRDWQQFDSDGGLTAFNAAHEAVWYPAYEKLPALRPMIFNIMRFVEGERLGGVLITKVPPGSMVKPHVDQGWHAKYFQKFGVQIASNDRQAFSFEDTSLISMPGDLYTFNNSQSHWVTNESDIDRITLIICIKTSRSFLEEFTS